MAIAVYHAASREYVQQRRVLRDLAEFVKSRTQNRTSRWPWWHFAATRTRFRLRPRAATSHNPRSHTLHPYVRRTIVCVPVHLLVLCRVMGTCTVRANVCERVFTPKHTRVDGWRSTWCTRACRYSAPQ